MVKLRFLLVALLVIGAASFTSWLLRTLGESPLLKNGAINREPDYYFEGFAATARDIKGKVKYRLEAQQLEHFPYNESMLLRKPYIEMFGDKGQPWQAWAEQGVYFDTHRTINLTGTVRIHRAGDASNQAVTLLTDAITLDMKNNIAQTNSDIQLTSGDDILNATGLKVEMDTGRLELHSKVKGKYEAPKQN